MKQSEIKNMSISDLEAELTKFKSNYSDLKMAHSVTPLENPLQLRSIRRSIARIATELTKRSLNV